MTNIKIDGFTTFDHWHNDACCPFTNWEKICNIFGGFLPWPGKRAPAAHKITMFSWDDVPFTELQVSYHRGCWKRAVYRVGPGEVVLICKDWKGQQFGAVCPF